MGFPFTAVVGAGDLGVALLLAAVDPGLGGVLVRGEKGTAKTTMARALTGVLPRIVVADGCRFGCDPEHQDPACPDGRHDTTLVHVKPVPFVELPLGASEDRVLGSLHLDRLLTSGQVAFEPGLLARANRGVLYVDEVNLLPDHLVDSLLDAAATGRARVEREGASVEHAARFVLVGTMNPEEGDLRPQLLDRFGLAVDVRASRDPAVRGEVVRRRLAYERDPAGFAAVFASEEAALAERIATAVALLPTVTLDDDLLDAIVRVCADLGVDGLRGDLVTARAAVAHAAWSGRGKVAPDDVRVAARLALPHRRRRNPFDDHGEAADLDDLLARHLPDADPDPDPDPDPEPGPDDDGPGPSDEPDTGPENGSGAESDPATSEQTRPDDAGRDGDGDGTPDSSPASASHNPGDPDPAQPGTEPAGDTGQIVAAPDRAAAAVYLAAPRPGAGAAGRRATAITPRGRHLRAVLPNDPRGQGFSLVATILAALPEQPARGRTGGPITLASQDLRRSLRVGPEGNLVVFVVDASGSMGAAARVAQVKTAVVSLLLDAYQRRDRVAVIAFGGAGARVVLPPTSSVERAQRELADLPTGGRTPLAEALTLADDLVATAHTRDAQRRPLLVLLTDGRASAGPDALARSRAAADALAHRRVPAVVIDCERRRGLRLGLARDLARRLDAQYLDLPEVTDLRGVTVTAEHHTKSEGVA